MQGRWHRLIDGQQFVTYLAQRKCYPVGIHAKLEGLRAPERMQGVGARLVLDTRTSSQREELQ